MYDITPAKPQLLMAKCFNFNWEQSCAMDDSQKKFASLEHTFDGLAGKDTDVTLHNAPFINLDLM